jgi:hypothetical protein
MNVRLRLETDELALPAVCGQTGKPFVMVGRRQGRVVLELVRAIAIDSAPSVTGVPVAVHIATPTCTPWNFCSGCGQQLEPTWRLCRRCGRRVLPQPDAHAAPVRGFGREMSEDPAISFQALTMSAKIDIGSLYDGCPFCHARGYFHCGCGMFSCWSTHNRKPHLDHTDVWCEACRLWKCTSDEDEDDDSLSELTAYSAREKTIDLRSRIALGSTDRGQINRAPSIRGYLK